MGVEVVDFILKSLKCCNILNLPRRGNIYVHEVESRKIGNGTVLYDCYCYSNTVFNVGLFFPPPCMFHSVV